MRSPKVMRAGTGNKIFLFGLTFFQLKIENACLFGVKRLHLWYDARLLPE